MTRGFSKFWGWGIPSCEEPEVLESHLRELPPIFRSARYRRGGDLQVECLRQSARELPALMTLQQTVACQGPAATCASNEEVQVSANLIMDATDCFEIPQTEFVPLIGALAGPRLHLMGVSTSSSPGLLSQKHWREFQKNWPDQKVHLTKSEKASCRRLGVLFQDLSLPEPRAACEAWKEPQEALILLFAAAERFARVTAEIRESWDASQVDQTLAELDAGLEDRMILRYWTHLLGYLTEPREALQVTQEFVQTRSDESQRIRPGELAWVGFLTSDREPERQPAQEEGALWSSFLARHVDVPSVERLAKISQWLRWVSDRELAPACAAELWTMDRSSDTRAPAGAAE